MIDRTPRVPIGRRLSARMGQRLPGACLAAVLVMAMGAPARAQADAESAGPPRIGVEVATSHDVDALMNNAQRLLDRGRYYDGMQVLQRISDEFGDLLTYGDDGVYRPGRVAARRAIIAWAGKVPDTRKQYRILTDATVEAMLGDDPASARDEQKLRTVVDRYFLSTHGDDAALALASLLIDRQAYGEAASVLSMLVGEDRPYPDPSVDMTAVWSRLGLAAASLGDRARATEAIAALERADASSQLIRPIARRLAERASPGGSTVGRPGQAPRLEAVAEEVGDDAGKWGLLWTADSGWAHEALVRSFMPIKQRLDTHARDRLVARWLARAWLPTTMVRFSDEHLLYRAGAELVCVDWRTGRRRWASRFAASQRPDPPRLLVTNPRADGPGQPHLPDEVLFFGDRLSQRFCAGGGRVYAIVPSLDDADVRFLYGRRLISQGYSIVGLTGNRIAALDVATGERLWQTNLQSALDRERPLPVRFVSAPVLFGDRLLAVADDHGALSLVAIRAEDGQVLWRRHLCDQAPGYASAWAPVRLAIDGARIYIATGRGLVVAADAYSGRVQWMTPYRRGVGQPAGGQDHRAHLRHDAWDDSGVWIVGRTLAVTAADAEPLMVLDKASGQRLGHPRFDRMQYVLGTREGRVYAGGPGALACFDIDSRSRLWSTPVAGLSGRALLSGDTILAPAGRKLIRIDPATGQSRGVLDFGDRLDQPLGNLFTDGRRLFAAGIDRVQALGDVSEHLAALDRLSQAGDADALIARARRAERAGRYDQAAADYRRARQAMGEGEPRAAAESALLACLLRQAREAAQADQAAALLAEARQLARSDRDHRRVDLAEADRLAALGRAVDAARGYRDLAMSDAAVLIPPADDDPREVAVPSIAARRLAALGGGDPDAPIIAALQGPGRAALGALEKPADVAALHRIAAAHPRTAASAEAIGRLGAIAADPKAATFAAAELALLRLAGAAPATDAADALDQLANAYLTRGWPDEARSIHVRRTDRFGPAPDNDTRATAIARRLAETPASADVADGERLDPPPLARVLLCDEKHAQTLRLSHSPSLDQNAFLRDHVFVHRPGSGRITRYDPAGGAASGLDIALPEDMPTLFQRGRYGRVVIGGVDGHAMVIASPGRTMVVDLLSGATIWQRPADRTQVSEALAQYIAASGAEALPSFLAVGGGLVVELVIDPADGGTRIVASDLATGQALWRRPTGSARPLGVFVAGGRVLVPMVDAAPRLLVLDRWTGRRLDTLALPENALTVSYVGRQIVERELNFFDPELVASMFKAYGAHSMLDRHDTDEVLSDQALICLADGRLSQAGFDDQAANWTIRLRPKPAVAELLLGSPGHLLVTRNQGHAIMLDPRSGQTRWRIGGQRVGPIIYDAYLNDQADVLHVLGMGGFGRQTLFAVDPASGAKRHAISLLEADQQPTTARTLSRSGPFVPLLARDRRRQQMQLQVLSRDDGRPVAGAVGDASMRGDLSQPYRIRGGALVLPTTRGVVIYRNAQ